MLVKLKRGLHRAKETVYRPFRGDKREKLGLHDFHVNWDGLKSFSGVSDKSAHAREPLKSVIDELWRCMEMFESNQHMATIRSLKEYEKLGIEINDLFRVLSKCLDGTSTTSTTDDRVTQLAQDIESETNVLRCEPPETEQDVERVNIDVRGVLRCYRRILTLLGRFTLNGNRDIWKIPDENLLATRLESLHSPAAPYRSDVRRTGCTPNTRINLLQQLQCWVHYNGGQRIYWLNGLAGTGKSAIAYTFCEQLEGAGKLAASFFCSRLLPGCRDVKRILPSISYQLSSISRPFRCALSGTLEDSEVHNLPLSKQLTKLVAKPLLKVKHTFPANMVIVIDALDECEDDEGVNQILGILLMCTSNLPVKFFITSRPSPTILNRMRNKWDERVVFELRLHEVDRPAVQEDIRTYLSTKLEPANLPEPDIATLVQRSGLLFIHAATIVNYIGYKNFSQSIERLNLVLGVSISSTSGSDQDIDIVYTSILQETFGNSALEPSNQDEMTLMLRTTVCAQEPLTVEVLAGLLKLDDASSVDNALPPLQPLLQLSYTNGLVTTLHESFQTYMLDQQRSGRFYCDARQHHAMLAQACFDLIAAPSPPFNICKLESSYLRDQEVPGIDRRVKEAISPELLYACRYWGAHVQLAGDSKDILNRLQEFLATRLLLWMEILNLNRCMDAGISQLYRLRTWLEKIEEPADLIKNLAHDAWKFVVAFSSSPMSDTTPHIYLSMLPFWPERWPVSTHYMRGMIAPVKATGAGMRKREWAALTVLSAAGEVASVACSPNSAYVAYSSPDKTIRIRNAYTGESVAQLLNGHTLSTHSVAYSPNGGYIVSGTPDNTIHIWDAYTGQPVGQPLEGHTDSVHSVSYSPNGGYIASGSSDKTIRIWDAYTGQPVGRPLRGHRGWVYSVAYSPNGAYIVSGSSDSTIRIWDAHAGQPVGQPFKGHTSSVYSVAYSPNGAYIVSGSGDKTIRIWDAHTGQPVGQPLKGHTRSVYSVAYSPNGPYIVSGSQDKSIRMWDAHTGQPVCQPLKGHTDSVNTVAYSPNGAYIVSGSLDKTIRIWDTRQWEMPPAEVLSVDPILPSIFKYLSLFAQLVLLILKMLTSQVTQCEFNQAFWTLNRQGWVVNNNKNRLIWVPRDVRDILFHPQSTAVVSRSGSVRLDFINAKLGEEWEQCFNPKQVPGVN